MLNCKYFAVCKIGYLLNLCGWSVGGTAHRQVMHNLSTELSARGWGGVEYNIIMKIAPTIRRKKISKGTGVYDKKVVDKWWCGVVEWKKKSSVGW